MIIISMKSIKLKTIFCCNMFHDHEKFLQQKHLYTIVINKRSLTKLSFYTQLKKRKFFL